jgi:hypothetical protein
MPDFIQHPDSSEKIGFLLRMVVLRETAIKIQTLDKYTGERGKKEQGL